MARNGCAGMSPNISVVGGQPAVPTAVPDLLRSTQSGHPTTGVATRRTRLPRRYGGAVRPRLDRIHLIELEASAPDRREFAIARVTYKGKAGRGLNPEVNPCQPCRHSSDRHLRVHTITAADRRQLPGQLRCQPLSNQVAFRRIRQPRSRPRHSTRRGRGSSGRQRPYPVSSGHNASVSAESGAQTDPSGPPAISGPTRYLWDICECLGRERGWATVCPQSAQVPPESEQRLALIGEALAGPPVRNRRRPP